MDSSSPSSSSPGLPQPEADAKREEREKKMLHRTKLIQFLGRTAPIILQNDNGPCPLLAICNVLSLRNSLNLSPDISEISQEKLLSLVAERLIDSNSNIDNKDTGYIENQQQNIADAIDLLPRLTTGIDVNIKFRRIDDFEFTRECAIFDLLDIPLYHGWIVDPQGHETAAAIGSKSYNTLMGELVSLETQTTEGELEKNPEDDGVDFVAATTAALGVPSPCLSRGQSFDDSPQRARKGDIEEADLLKVMKFSEGEKSNSSANGVAADANLRVSAMNTSKLVIHSETVEKNAIDETIKTDLNISTQPTNISTKCCENADEGTVSDAKIENKNVQLISSEDPPSASSNSRDKTQSREHIQNELTSTSDPDEPKNNISGLKAINSSSFFSEASDSESSDQMHKVHKPEAFASSIDGCEPIYEGEESIMAPKDVIYDNREPIYEGEVVLAGQVDSGCTDDGDRNDRISVKQGELIRNFMKNSASQLTVYGLFCLLDKVKERELCVFFRNNHFNTMFKFEGELYILATDQGYISQPDLVWEKLNEVNGDTVYMMGNFKEFKMDDHSNTTWDEQNAVANTADYMASIDSTDRENSSFNSDLQLAIALQQQEFEQREQQQQPQPPNSVQQPAMSGGSKLVTGPQVSRSSGKYATSSKQKSKSKEKCTIM